MQETKIGPKEKLAILLAEYNSLRSEINSRVSSSYQLIGIGSAALAWLLQQPVGRSFWIGLGILLLGGAYWYRLVNFEIFNAGRRVRELETEINSLAGEKILVWETERGGLSPGYQRRVFLPFLKTRSRKVSKRLKKELP